VTPLGGSGGSGSSTCPDCKPLRNGPRHVGPGTVDAEPSPGDVLQVAARYHDTDATISLDGEFGGRALLDRSRRKPALITVRLM
jgi:hypothetical protein